MTLKLVADNTVELPVVNLQNLGDMARELGRRLDAGEYGNVISCITIVASEESLGTYTWGNPRNGYELMGLFEAAKLRAFADGIVED